MPERQWNHEELRHEIARLKRRISELEDSDSKIIELQEDLEDAEEFGVAVIECTPNPLFVVSTDGAFRRWNPSFESLTGYGLEELKSLNSFEVFDDSEAFRRLVEEAEMEGHSSGTVQVIGKAAPPMMFDVNLERIHCHGVFCIVCALFDSQQKELHDKLKRAGAIASAKVALLSRRQREVFDYVVNGTPNKNIAAELGISEKTVEMHRSTMMKKLDVNNMASLVRLAVLADLTESASDSSVLDDML